MPEDNLLDVFWTAQALEDMQFWRKSGKKQVVDKINRMVEECRVINAPGIGKAHRLRFNLQGKLSKRITDEHRLVYRIDGNLLSVLQCRFHY